MMPDVKEILQKEMKTTNNLYEYFFLFLLSLEDIRLEQFKNGI